MIKTNWKALISILILVTLMFSISGISLAKPGKGNGRSKKADPTPTPIATPTPEPTYMPTPTTSPTFTPSPTPIPTPTPTPMPTPSPTPVPTPTPTPTPSPTPIPNTSKVIGYTTYYYNGDTSSYNSMVNNIGSYDEIITATHITDENGNITGVLPTNQLTFASDNNISSQVLLGNNFDGYIAHNILTNPEIAHNLINNLIDIISTHNYNGVSIDLEGVYYYDRNNYTDFIKEVYNTLRPLGYSVSISVPAKTYDSTTNSWNGAFDYKALSQYADNIIIMTYDEHYPGGTPGPIASISWYENVIKYALTVMPKEKIYLGAATYGYDWSSIGTKAYSINSCYNLAAKYNSQVLWDDTYKAPYFTYYDVNNISHEVWFENEESLGYKLDIVNTYGVGGIAIWRLGLENSDYWNVINTKLY